MADLPHGYYSEFSIRKGKGTRGPKTKRAAEVVFHTVFCQIEIWLPMPVNGLALGNPKAPVWWALAENMTGARSKRYSRLRCTHIHSLVLAVPYGLSKTLVLCEISPTLHWHQGNHNHCTLYLQYHNFKGPPFYVWLTIRMAELVTSPASTVCQMYVEHNMFAACLFAWESL